MGILNGKLVTADWYVAWPFTENAGKYPLAALDTEYSFVLAMRSICLING
jgi:hypothetical protein